RRAGKATHGRQTGRSSLAPPEASKYDGRLTSGMGRLDLPQPSSPRSLPTSAARYRGVDAIARCEVRAGAAPRELPPPAEGISLWWCELPRTPSELAVIARTLSAAEIARAARFGTDALRHRWMAGRAALRQVLRMTLGIAPSEVAIRRGMRGRRELTEGSARIDFNVSHTRDV